LFAQWDECTASAAGKETEVANTNEAARQDMKKETAEKLIGTKCHEAFPVVVSRVSEAERDLFAVEGDQPVIRDGNAMGISSEVSEHLIGSAERWFAVDDPTVAEQLSEKTPKQPWLSERLELPVEPEFARCKGLL
jgi:hypothetical protein